MFKSVSSEAAYFMSTSLGRAGSKYLPARLASCSKRTSYKPKIKFLFLSYADMLKKKKKL
jgi:hypothetical protein